jgi:UDP-N-acetylmuramate--alanine ligase
LAHEFGLALSAADVSVLLDVYPARERAEDFPGISGRLIASAAADAGGQVAWLPGFEDARPYLESLLREGDLCLLMGAGNIDALSRSLVPEAHA